MSRTGNHWARKDKIMDENKNSEQLSVQQTESVETGAKEKKGGRALGYILCVLLGICIGLGGALLYVNTHKAPAQQTPVEESAAPISADEDEAVPFTAPEEVKTLDLEAMYALHSPDEVVMTVNGNEVKWSELFYWIRYYGTQIESYLNSARLYYGVDVDWSDTTGDEESEGETYAQLVSTNAIDTLGQVYSILKFGEDYGVQVDETEVAELLESDIEATCGEGATVEDFEAAIAEDYMTREIYDRMTRISFIYRDGLPAVYGVDGADLSDEEMASFAAEYGYMAAEHILFLTTDDNGATLSDEEVAAKKTLAEETAARLRAVENAEERLALFKELQQQYTEDPGIEYYPDGYIFTPGTMYQVFEDAVAAQGEYDVSEPVLSSRGYHVIMTMPLKYDVLAGYSSEGTAMTLRAIAANNLYGQLMQRYNDGVQIEMAQGFTLPKTADYLK